MPESAKDRCTTAHSYVFQLSKSARYFFDADAIAEPAAWERWGDQTVPKHDGTPTASGWVQPKARTELPGGKNADHVDRRKVGFNERWDATMRLPVDAPQEESLLDEYVNPGNRTTNGQRGRSEERRGFDQGLELAAGKNLRSVWSIPTEGNALALCAVCGAFWEGGAPRRHCGQPVVQHFAAWAQRLVEVMVKAGTSERGVCAECGAPWARVVAREPMVIREGPGREGFMEASAGSTQRPAITGTMLAPASSSTLDWRATCTCGAGDPVPATILDPFLGSGTTALVARRLGRRCVGVDLNSHYCEMSKRRLAQQSLFATEPVPVEAKT